jgi:DNA-binding NarL/FixJ family response regulator
LIIVDDDQGIRDVLRQILESSEARVVAEADNGRSAIEQAEIFHPDVIVLDVSMPVMGGFAAARELRQRMPEIRIIFLSQHTDRAYLEEAFRIGAGGFIAKRNASRELLDAIRAVLSGTSFVSSAIAEQSGTQTA